MMINKVPQVANNSKILNEIQMGNVRWNGKNFNFRKIKMMTSIPTWSDRRFCMLLLGSISLMIFHPKFGRSPSLTSLTKAIFTWNKINISTSEMVSLRDKLDFKGGFKSNCKTEIGCYFLLQLNSLNFISYLSFLQLQSFQTFIPFLL